MESLKEKLDEFLCIKDGIWTFKPGYILAKRNNMIGLRIDLGFLNRDGSNRKIILDFINGKVINAFTLDEFAISNLSEMDVAIYVDQFKMEYQNAKINSMPLMHVKDMFAINHKFMIN